MIAIAGPVSAKSPQATPIDPQHSLTQDPSAAGKHLQELLYQELCALNENWTKYSPNYEILTLSQVANDEVSLIQTHLKLVLDRLGTANLDHLDSSQRQNRRMHLRTMHTYMTEGQFPQNVFAPGRHPVFIDPWGTHCAVGHLIATSGHAHLAIAINRNHQLDLLRDIQTEGLIQWQQASGFSIDELALIQPTYRSSTLKYPQEIEQLILGNSDAIVAKIESGELQPAATGGGKTLLHFAAAAGDLELVKMLVDRGADVHAVSTLGCEKEEIYKGGSQKIVEVRWDQPTAVLRKSGRGIGDRANVYQTLRGKYVAYLLNDIRGGRAGLNALDYALDDARNRRFSPPMYNSVIRHRFGRPPEPRAENPELVSLKNDRAAVAEWLKDQGLSRQNLAADTE